MIRLALPLAMALTLAGCDEHAGAGAAPTERSAPAATSSASVAKGPPESSASAKESAAKAELTFVRDGKKVSTKSLAELTADAPAEQWTAFDPYYNKPKTYRALPLARVLEKAFGEPAEKLAQVDYVMRARDGYTVPLAGATVFEKGGYIAVADVDVPGWEPIGQQQANPGPFYLVWREPSQKSLDTHPRPWQLATIEIAPFEATFPHTVPTGLGDGTPEMRGLRIFRAQCIACHAVNREGGRVGPDLNVPQSIVEYRPEAQIRAYIRDPRTFRYSNMPAHPGLKEDDLDGIIAYFRAMKDRKHDPEAGKAQGH